MPRELPNQPPPVPYEPPAHLQFHFDPVARILRIEFRGRLDLALSRLDLPVPLVKRVAAEVIAFEAQAELSARTN